MGTTAIGTLSQRLRHASDCGRPQSGEPGTAMKCLRRAAVGFLGVLVLSACETKPYEDLRVFATISADGKVIAALTKAESEKSRVRVMYLDKPNQWIDLPTPPNTSSIQFGLQGHELLITSRIGESADSVLSKLDIDKPQKGLIALYKATGLAYPFEVAAGEYLVRFCPPKSDNKCHPWFNGWDLIRDGQLIYRYLYTETKFSLNYSQLNIVRGEGFFWMRTPGEYGENEKFPQIRSLAFPGKDAPKYDVSGFESNSYDLNCDYTSTRCLKTYIKNIDKKGPGNFVYDIQVLYKSKKCLMQGTEGFADRLQMSPDGNHAILSATKVFDSPRHIVVMQFKPNQCEPISVQEFDLKG